MTNCIDNKLFILILQFSLLCFCGCTTNTLVESSKTAYVKDNAYDSSFYNSFEIKDIVYLDSTIESLMCEANRIEIYKSNYYILDEYRNKCIYQFDSKGRYIRKIGQIGHGRGEYITIRDFCINRTNGHIIILSAASTIYEYSASGEFVKSQKIAEGDLWYIDNVSNHFVASFDHRGDPDKSTLLVIYDNEWNVVNKIDDDLQEYVIAGSVVPRRFVAENNKLYYFDPYIPKFYIFDFNNKSEEYKSINIDMNSKDYTSVFYSMDAFNADSFVFDFFHQFCEINGEIYTFMIVKNELYLYVLDTNTQSHRMSKYKGFLPKILYSDEKYIYSILSPDEYNYLIDSNYINKNKIDVKSNYIILKIKTIK